MKCLLMTPPTFSIVRESLPSVVDDQANFAPPLGLLHIAAYAESVPNMEVRLVDTNAEQMTWQEIKDFLLDWQPEVVGIQVMTFLLIDAYALARLVRECCPECVIVMGGPHPTIYPKETVNNPFVDYVIYGEGEFAFRDLLICLQEERSSEGIQGVVTKQTDTNTLTLQYIEDLDALLPLPLHLMNFDIYKSVFSPDKRLATLMSSRGCPGRCTFCDRPQMGKRFRKKSAQAVFTEMKRYVEGYNVGEILFYDDTFTIDKQRVLELCDLIQQNGLKVRWDIRARIDTMNPEMISALAQAGCNRIHYGVETGDQGMQKRIQKNLNLDVVRDVVKMTNKAGIETLGYFMLGLPSESPKEVEKTLAFMCSVPFDYAHIAIFTPYPATAVYRQALEQGIYPNDYWRDFAENPKPEFHPEYWNEFYTTEELKQLLTSAYRKFYARPSYLFRRLRQVRSINELYSKAMLGYQLLFPPK